MGNVLLKFKQMQMKHICKLVSCISVSFCILSSCTDRVVCKRIDFSDCINVIPDSIAPETLMSPAGIAISNGFLIVGNSNQDSLLTVMDLPSLTISNRGLLEGNGPGEVISPYLPSLMPYSSNAVSLRIGGIEGLAIVDIPSLSLSEIKYWTVPSGWDLIQSIVPVGEDKIFAQNGNSSAEWALIKDGEVQFSIPSNLPEEVKKELNDNDEGISERIAKISIGLYSPVNNRYAVCFRTFPVIRIYDGNGKQVTAISADYQYMPMASWISGAFAGKNVFYVCFTDPRQLSPASKIAVFDWDGNFLKGYCIQKEITFFAPDEGHGTIYFTTKNDNDLIYFFKIGMP